MAQQPFIASIDILKIWDQANWANPEPVSCRFSAAGSNPVLWAFLFYIFMPPIELSCITPSTAGENKDSASVIVHDFVVENNFRI